MSKTADETVTPQTEQHQLDDDESTSNYSSDGKGEDYDEYKPGEPRLLDDGRWDVKPERPMKVVKKFLKEGAGECPPRRSQCSLLYTGKFEDGKVFDERQDSNSPYVFKLGIGEIMKGWDIAVASMKVGEISEFSIAADYAYGEAGLPPKIAANMNLVFVIELLSFEKEPITGEEKIEYATQHKELGNALIKTKNYAPALVEYDKALVAVGYFYSRKKSLRPQIQSLQIALHLNASFCCLKVTPAEFARARAEAEAVLKLDPHNVKALYRHGLAWLGEKYYEDARADFLKALTYAPTDAAIRSELVSVTEKIKKTKAQQMKQFSELFAPTSVEGAKGSPPADATGGVESSVEPGIAPASDRT
jgi:tetratricopeptide (TPR) repeat protein